VAFNLQMEVPKCLPLRTSAVMYTEAQNAAKKVSLSISIV
jgi:hypothetical protein